MIVLDVASVDANVAVLSQGFASSPAAAPQGRDSGGGSTTHPQEGFSGKSEGQSYS